MPKIELERSLGQPAVPAREAGSQILKDIAADAGIWQDFALHLNLGALGLPDVGYVAIPVRLKISGEEAEPRHQITFTIQARQSAEVFPVFQGAIGIDSSGPSSSQVWLAGEYEVPLSGLGAFFDKAVARGAAAKTLENFLSDVVEAIAARVEKRELAEARYRLFGSGD
ncbi:MAG TPA: hypothetical protein VFW34_10535 [Candidatus Rubrimentiphilum sp.]|nr:hypothetical protein [Candidatus Rubrimentiphilum sp.]